jgi:hypothetical protein
MMAERPTYTQLFSFLQDLGFRAEASDDFERVFLHEPTETVLLFSLLDDPSTDRPVTEADFTSAETHLRGKELIGQPLGQLLEAHAEERN